VAAMAAAARNSTRAYMDSLAGGNTYDDLFAAAFRPEHRDVLREMTTMATREAVATYLCPPHLHRWGGLASGPRSGARRALALHLQTVACRCGQPVP